MGTLTTDHLYPTWASLRPGDVLLGLAGPTVTLVLSVEGSAHPHVVCCRFLSLVTLESWVSAGLTFDPTPGLLL